MWKWPHSWSRRAYAARHGRFVAAGIVVERWAWCRFIHEQFATEGSKASTAPNITSDNAQDHHQKVDDHQTDYNNKKDNNKTHNDNNPPTDSRPGRICRDWRGSAFRRGATARLWWLWRRFRKYPLLYHKFGNGNFSVRQSYTQFEAQETSIIE